MTTDKTEREPGHCSDDAAWAEFRDRYLPMKRERLCGGDMTDFALANHVFMVDRSDLGLIVAQTAAKDRIRWLSVQLAEKTAEAARLQEEVKGLRDVLRPILRLRIAIAGAITEEPGAHRIRLEDGSFVEGPAADWLLETSKTFLAVTDAVQLTLQGQQS